jgi:hypothetical protein
MNIIKPQYIYIYIYKLKGSGDATFNTQSDN